MFIKEIFRHWNENTYNLRHFSHLKCIRSYSIEEYKQFFNVSKVIIKKHPSGFLFFETIRMEDWGLVYSNSVPQNPVISLMSDFHFNLFFVLHDVNVTPSSITINSNRYQIALNHSSTNKHNSTYQSREEYNEYLRESYMDAFEGDSDACWNID